jgi:hypothetical protein
MIYSQLIIVSSSSKIVTCIVDENVESSLVLNQLLGAVTNRLQTGQIQGIDNGSVTSFWSRKTVFKLLFYQVLSWQFI